MEIDVSSNRQAQREGVDDDDGAHALNPRLILIRT
jgi:hypothetical protein